MVSSAYELAERARTPVPSVQHPTNEYFPMVGLMPSVPVGAADVEVEVEVDTIVEVDVASVDEIDEETGFDVDEDTTDEDVEEGREAVDVRYSSKRFPEPQYSRLLPPQTMLQSARGADELVLARELPQ